MEKGIVGSWHKNSVEVAQRIFNENQRLIYWCLQRFRIPQNDYDDCYQEAAWGLYYCALHFNENTGTSFATYAVPSIDGRVRRYLREKTNVIRTPRKLIDATHAIAKYTEENDIEEGRVLNWLQLEEIGITEKEYYETIQAKSICSLEDKIEMRHGDTAELMEVIPGKNNIDELFEDGTTLVDDFLNYYTSHHSNSEIKADIFRDFCNGVISGLGSRQRELSKKYGFSQSYISRIIQQMKEMFINYYTRYYIKDGD